MSVPINSSSAWLWRTSSAWRWSSYSTPVPSGKRTANSGKLFHELRLGNLAPEVKRVAIEAAGVREAWVRAGGDEPHPAASGVHGELELEAAGRLVEHVEKRALRQRRAL